MGRYQLLPRGNSFSLRLSASRILSESSASRSPPLRRVWASSRFPPSRTLSRSQAMARASSPVNIDAVLLESLLPNPALLAYLEASLPSASASVVAPLRQVFPIDSASSSLLLMPAWPAPPAAGSLPYFGVKLVTSFSGNSARGLPGVHAAYVLFDAVTGAVLAFMDGTQLTLRRTAAISALAAKILARGDSRVLVMVGAGALAPYLVRAHLLVRPSIRRVVIWNRTATRARDLAESLGAETEIRSRGVEMEWTTDLDGAVSQGDVVSCATSATEPMVKGALLRAGAHLDLVGSFTPSMRECDDEAMRKGRVFVDCEAAMEEAGELQSGEVPVAGRLAELLEGGGGVAGRCNEEEVTIFKSVGSATWDLLAAQVAYDAYLRGVAQ